MGEELLRVEDLFVEFKTGSIVTKAINGVSFSLHQNETLGIVGESGSGKSVTASAAMRLIPNPPGRITSGSIVYKGQDISQLNESKMRKLRGNEMSMIFQDPTTSLNPVFTVGHQLMESIRIHKNLSKREAKQESLRMLELVGIPAAKQRLKMYPHEFSGGMRQRVMIAIALSCQPQLLIADEPTTALDVTVQAQILALMKDLQREFGMAIMMITHDLGVVWETCDSIIVMYAGQVMERGSVRQVYDKPLHPYTWGLLDSQIASDQNSQEVLPAIPGSPPDLSFDVQGCPFADRCPYVEEICRESKPARVAIEDGHEVACHFQTDTSELTRKEEANIGASATGS
ncbi:ABC transporter ATP-binding protein [Geomicrobium sp. JCM 19039]|uniref:ABC transporter ATP-binding protein n=1 Tax=Geomicrobium sp. JCM 19039 TaxID=1460636 RepID=UPI00045F252A|nr:ABC transporter ATP-binding protein [Geomicrobium sp. JCM 19039]GAK13935.1 oligopeptide transport ATP-binding protein OppD [Geomicrobium sp. JCM 19039]